MHTQHVYACYICSSIRLYAQYTQTYTILVHIYIAWHLSRARMRRAFTVHYNHARAQILRSRSHITSVYVSHIYGAYVRAIDAVLPRRRSRRGAANICTRFTWLTWLCVLLERT